MSDQGSFVHKTLKWSNQAVFHLLDVAIVNSYKLSHQERKHKSHAQYRLDIANSLLVKAGHITMEENVELQSPHRHSQILCVLYKIFSCNIVVMELIMHCVYIVS